jgi:hypothetical protein
MSWEHRGSQQYYYRVRYQGGRLTKTYYGTGRAAKRAVAEDLRRRTIRKHAQAENQRLQQLDTQLKDFTHVVQTLVKATLLSAGYHQHKRVWRKRRQNPTPPQEGRTPMHAHSWTIASSTYDTLATLVAQAQQGDTTTLPVIRSLLDQVPELWQDSRILAQQVERSWLTTLCGHDVVSQEVVAREVQALRRHLVGAHPSPLESLLVDRICTCWLAVQHAELHTAKRLKTSSVALSTAEEQRLDKVHRRFLTAIRELARVRKLLQPEARFQVNIGTNQIVA